MIVEMVVEPAPSYLKFTKLKSKEGDVGGPSVPLLYKNGCTAPRRVN